MLHTFDIIAYLTDRGIPFWTEGDNVSEGWVNIACPYCGDHFNHLGINLGSKGFHCWRCGEKGLTTKVIAHLERISWGKALEIIEQFQDPFGIKDLKEKRLERYKGEVMPREATPDLPEPHQRWLAYRRFDPLSLRNHYDLHACYAYGDYAYRIIIPIKIKDRIVSFVARDVTTEQPIAYKNSPIDKSIVPPKEALYNIDRVKDVALVVEGVTDVWRIGDGAVATFGTAWTNPQVKMLEGLRKVFVMFDGEKEATKKAHEFAHAVGSLVDEVEVIEMSSGDPDDMEMMQVCELRREIFGTRNSYDTSQR